MKFSDKSRPCLSLDQFHRTARVPDGPPLTYGNLQGTHKDRVKRELAQEQDGLCCYCGRKLRDDFSHIEHYWPQTKFPDISTSHHNLFVSCGDNQTKGRANVTCGEAKDGHYLRIKPRADSLIPSDPDCESRFRYWSNGDVEPTTPDDAEAQWVIDKTALDTDRMLRSDRSAVLSAFDRYRLKADPNVPFDFEYELEYLKSGTGRQEEFSQAKRRLLECSVE